LKVKNNSVVLSLLLLLSATFLTSAILNAGEFRDSQIEQVRKARKIVDWDRVEARIARRFTDAGLSFPPEKILIRVFKLERILEVWAMDDEESDFRFVCYYPFTSFSGDLGPKRQQGDLQIPEGFYHINNFNPWSSYHLSLQINYPNKSDRILKKGEDPGGLIFIHGSEVTIGCIPIGDRAIEELYVAAVDTKDKDQNKIPVHIFPYRMSGYVRDLAVRAVFPEWCDFWNNLREGFNIFQNTKQLPKFNINDEGKYIFLN